MVAEQFNEVNIFYREIVRNNNSDYQSSTGCAEENPNINKAKGSEAEDLSPSPTNIDAEGGDHEESTFLCYLGFFVLVLVRRLSAGSNQWT